MRTRSVFCIVFATGFLIHPAWAESTPTLPQQYLEIYLGIRQAEESEKQHDYSAALKAFQGLYAKLAEIHGQDPDFETALVLSRLGDCKFKIIDLEQKIASPPPPQSAAVPNLAAPAGHPAAIQIVPLSQITPLHPPPGLHFPWKDNVVPALFWIGEHGSSGSAWDPHWVRDNNGVDSPYDRNGYNSGKHASTQNPFYVALPFNDLAFPDLARSFLPAGWVPKERNGTPVSTCKDRWLEIKNAEGEICYAQWEDVGPGRGNQAEYVFGNQEPAKDGPGLGVSPAVADYLRLDAGKSMVAWRFVNPGDVRPGVWLKCDEQALVYVAMRETDRAKK